MKKCYQWLLQEIILESKPDWFLILKEKEYPQQTEHLLKPCQEITSPHLASFTSTGHFYHVWSFPPQMDILTSRWAFSLCLAISTSHGHFCLVLIFPPNMDIFTCMVIGIFKNTPCEVKMPIWGGNGPPRWKCPMWGENVLQGRNCYASWKCPTQGGNGHARWKCPHEVKNAKCKVEMAI